MAYTRTWNAANEASPADSDSVSAGAAKIRNFKVDIRERMAKDHYMDVAGTDADHGEHSQATFREQAADPTQVTAKTFLYRKDGILKLLNYAGLGSGEPVAFNLAQGTMFNGKIVVTAAGNNLNVALKTLKGNDPSTDDPVVVRIGDVYRIVVAALSVTAAKATNWCNSGGVELATFEVDYFVYLGYNATDGVVIGFSRLSGATCYANFSTTSTDEKFCKISTITTAAATDYYEVVGRFAATLSATAAFTWTIPTYTAINLIQKPIFESRQLTFNVATADISLSASSQRYRVTREGYFLDLYLDGTGFSTGFTVNLPFKGLYSMNYACVVVDNAIYSLGFMNNAAGSNDGVLYFGTVSTWTASGGRSLTISVRIPV